MMVTLLDANMDQTKGVSQKGIDHSTLFRSACSMMVFRGVIASNSKDIYQQSSTLVGDAVIYNLPIVVWCPASQRSADAKLLRADLSEADLTLASPGRHGDMQRCGTGEGD